MDPIPPEAFLSAFPDPIRVIGERLRTLVTDAVPDAAAIGPLLVEARRVALLTRAERFEEAMLIG